MADDDPTLEAVFETQARRDRRFRGWILSLVAAFIIGGILSTAAFVLLLDRFNDAEKTTEDQNKALFILICESQLQAQYNDSVPVHSAAAFSGNVELTTVLEAYQRRIAAAQAKVIRDVLEEDFEDCPIVSVNE